MSKIEKCFSLKKLRILLPFYFCLFTFAFLLLPFALSAADVVQRASVTSQRAVRSPVTTATRLPSAVASVNSATVTPVTSTPAVTPIVAGTTTTRLPLVAAPVVAATTTTTAPVIASIASEPQSLALYSTECHDAFYSCMDAFCDVGNSHNIPELATDDGSYTIDGGACACSDDNAGLVSRIDAMRTKLADAENIRTVGVEKIEAGARADIIFSGTREYDENGNVVTLDDKVNADAAREKRRANLMSMFETSIYDDDPFADDIDSISDKTGRALYSGAMELCNSQMPPQCARDWQFLTQTYSARVRSECAAFTTDVAKAERATTLAVAEANSAVRGALRDSFASANEYDRGTCMVNFKKCMTTADACGTDWANCVGITASQDMIARRGKSGTGQYFNISENTQEILNGKRNICENILDKCIAVRDMVWTDFLTEAAPTLRFAELNAESKMRGSCLSDISECVQTACRDEIAGKGVATMDACLARPDMVKSMCRVQLEPCEKMDSDIWAYVSDKLKAMRVDACTAEVKSCFTSSDRCGADFSKCIGMDYDYIHEICPLDKLVVCRAGNPNFAMTDLDSMLMGLYLNIDNSALDVCQNKIDAKMGLICGSSTDCNRFASDDTIGTGSLASQKIGDLYRVTGMISFGSIKMGNASGRVRDGDVTLGVGQIGVADYITNARTAAAGVPNSAAILSSIEAELNNIAGTINRTIEMISSDPEIGFCIYGRDLSQIRADGGTTAPRFPHLMDSVKMQIAVAALRRAQDNYNAKFNDAVVTATKGASLDVAQYICQMMPMNGGAGIGGVEPSTPLTAPYAISYDVGVGLTLKDLARGGHDRAQDTGSTVLTDGRQRIEIADGGYREMWSVFSRETRTCHYCSQTVTKNCKTMLRKGFLGIGRKSETSCAEESQPEECHDIEM